MKKFGFTLVEIVITFGVIAAVAFYGLAVLNQESKKVQRNAAVKAVHTKLTDAWNLAVEDLGYPPRCAYWGTGDGANPNPVEVDTVVDPVTGEKHWYIKGTNDPLPDTYNGLFQDCKDFGNAIINRLVVTKSCFGNSYADGCTPSYAGNDDLAAANGAEGLDIVTQTSSASGFRASNMNNKNHAFVLADGTIIVGYMSTKYFHPRIFAVDINGVKGPNKWGHDLFAFHSEFGYDGKKINLVGHQTSVFPGGVQTSDILNDRK